VAFAISAAGGQKLIQADVNHDSCDGGKTCAHHLAGDIAAKDNPQAEVTDGCPNGFRQSAEERVGKGLSSASGGVEKRHRNADPFWNIVEGDGHGDGDPDLGIFQRGQKSGESFGKVVEGDGERGEEGHPQ